MIGRPLDILGDGENNMKLYNPKRLQPNNIRCKEKQIAKRRVKNKNKKR